MTATVSLIGYIAKEPEIKYLDSGKCLWRASIPVQSISKNSEGEYPTTWYQLIAWGELAERLMDQKYPNGDSVFTKGAYVNAVGKLQLKSYTGKDGVEKSQLEVTVVNIDRLKVKTSTPEETSKSNTTSKPAATSKKVSNQVEDVDVPF